MANRVQQSEAVLLGFRHPTTNAVLVGGYVKFLASGTLNTKAVWLDPDKTTPVTKVQLDARGAAQVFLQGIYDFEVYDGDPDAGGVLLITLEGLRYEYPVNNTRTVITDTTVTADDDVILVDSGTGPKTVTIDATVITAHPIRVLKKSSDLNAVTMQPASGQTINGLASVDFTARNANYTIASDGTNLYAFGAFADEANSLDGFHASQTPGANLIPVADSGGNLDIGWMPIGGTDPQYLLPPGIIWEYGGASAPTGWLLCQGQAISRTTYAGLFAVLGTTYGVGDGSTTFNIPDRRGRAGIGSGQSGSLTNRVLGTSGGAETHTLQTTEIPGHTHPLLVVPGAGSDAATATGTRFKNQLLDGGYILSIDTISTTNNSNPIGSTGGGGSHANMQPWVAMNYIIKT